MITLDNLFFSYNKTPFIENLSLEVKEGEVFGFLGPSGAGKSTLQKILLGLLPSYKGSVKVLGEEVKHKTSAFYENIGVDFEYPALYEKLTALENLKFFASLYKNNTCDFSALLSSVNLLYDKDKKVSQFSKGMKSRLSFIKALINNPKVLFLDEMTSGLDPTNSALLKQLILEQKKKGVTIILTTHNMEDAKELCDRVAFIVDGKIKALDTPHALIMKKGSFKVTYSYLKNEREITNTCLLSSLNEDNVFTGALANNTLLTIHSSEPSLGDIFMDVTGRRLS